MVEVETKGAHSSMTTAIDDYANDGYEEQSEFNVVFTMIICRLSLYRF